jgi:hypothetical protein
LQRDDGAIPAHAIPISCRDLSEADCTSLEVSIFKRGMHGAHRHCAEKHLDRWLAEPDFRYSSRVALGIDDVSRADGALKGIAGKGLPSNDGI